MVYKYSSIIIRLIFTVLFTMSALAKLTDIQVFAASMYSYQILSKDLVTIFAWYVPILELGLAIGFLLPSFCQITTVLTSLVMVVFQIALSSLIVRGIDIDCACFGNFAMTPKVALIRNFIILALSGLLLFLLRRVSNLQNWNDLPKAKTID